MARLKPFTNYFGSKYRTARYYPAPRHDRIVEPFAGALGYSVYHSVAIVDFAECEASMIALWTFLLSATAADVMRLPLLATPDDDIREWKLAPGPEALVAWNLSCGDPRPRYTLNGFAKKYRPPFPGHARDGRGYENFWGEKRRARIARQVAALKKWKLVADDYRKIENQKATWFIDPPYARSGKHYLQNGIDYRELAQWCRSREGLVIVCEQEGADWLPFKLFRTFKAGGHGASPGRKEVVWIKES